MPLLIALSWLFLAMAPASAQPVAPPASEDCGCGVPASPRGPR